MLHSAIFGHSRGTVGGLGTLKHDSLKIINAGAALYHAIPHSVSFYSASHLQKLALKDFGSSSRAQTWIKAVSLQ